MPLNSGLCSISKLTFMGEPLALGGEVVAQRLGIPLEDFQGYYSAVWLTAETLDTTMLKLEVETPLGSLYLPFDEFRTLKLYLFPPDHPHHARVLRQMAYADEHDDTSGPLPDGVRMKVYMHQYQNADISLTQITFNVAERTPEENDLEESAPEENDLEENDLEGEAVGAVRSLFQARLQEQLQEQIQTLIEERVPDRDQNPLQRLLWASRYEYLILLTLMFICGTLLPPLPTWYVVGAFDVILVLLMVDLNIKLKAS